MNQRCKLCDQLISHGVDCPKGILDQMVEPKLIPVKTMLDGERLETVEEAQDKAINGAVAELSDNTPADLSSAENIHDTLNRLGALKNAGKIGKIS